MSILDRVLPVESTNRKMMNSAVETLFDKTAGEIVGQPINRVEGALKVSGQAHYSAEIHLENQAYGVLVGATIAKGRVRHIDSSALEEIPNILTVVTEPDKFLRNAQQGGKSQAPTQGVTEVFYHGQPIAVVIAETFEAAREGANALKVTYEDETAEAALDFNQELSKAHEVNEKKGSDKNASQGDPDQALEQAAVVLDRLYHTPSQSGSAMEPHATLAHWQDDKVILYTSNQMLSSCKKQMADALDLDADQVQLIAHYVGGGFGSKLGIAPESIAAALAAKALNRPVLITMTRPQVMEATVRRSNTRQRIAIGCSESGVIDALIHETTSSNLPGESFFEPAALSTHYLYRGDHRRVHYQMVDMNQVLSGSMRAPGEAVGQIALECAMDELAEMLSLDPVELRRRNEPEQDPTKDIPFSTRQLLPCIEQAAAQFGWQDRPSVPATRLEGDWWLGMGMACAARGNMLAPSEARATLTLDTAKALGVKAIIETDMTDIGTGSYTVFTQIAAELLGLPVDHVEMRLGDTSYPPAVGSGGSMGAASSGSSIYLACEQLREKIAQRVGLHADTLKLHNGQVTQDGEHDPSTLERAVDTGREKLNAVLSTNLSTSLSTNLNAVTDKIEGMIKDKVDAGVIDTLGDRVKATLGDEASQKLSDIKDRVTTLATDTGIVSGAASTQSSSSYDFGASQSYPLAQILADGEAQQISVKGQIIPGKNDKSHRQSSFGANFAEVAIHRVTGEIRVTRMTGAFAAGRILNRKTATSQCYGGMVFGIGSALMEEVIHDKRDGRLCNHDLAEYHVPVNADVPQLDVILVEEDDPYTNPLHIKGIGETAISGAAAAIANAVYNAIGVRVYEFPITLDKLIAKLPDAP